MPADRRVQQYWFPILCTAAVVVAAALRGGSATGELWLDEIWTLDLIRDAEGSPRILALHHNNNHPLNTWFLAAIGDQGESFWIYRLHSIVAGVGSVILAGLIGWRRGKLESAFAIALTASSYLLIHFSTEARGYSLLVFFTLGAFHSLERFVDDRSLPSAALFLLCSVLGLLSHLFFVQFYIAAGLWSFAAMAKRSPLPVALKDTAIAHVGVLAFLGFFYFSFASAMHHGSAEPTGSVLWSVIQAASLGLGGPGEGTTAIAVSLLSGVVLASGLWVLRGDAQWQGLFYAAVCFGVPATLLWWNEPWAVFSRYFLVAITFELLLLAFVLAELARRSREGQRLAALVFALVLFGNVVNLIPLWRYGHGQYLAALRYMVEHRLGQAVTIGSDHPFRNGMLVSFYSALLPDEKIHYIDAGQGYPEWLIVHYPGSLAGRGDESVLYEDREYSLEEIFRSSDLAGFDWRLYRRLTQPAR